MKNEIKGYITELQEALENNSHGELAYLSHHIAELSLSYEYYLELKDAPVIKVAINRCYGGFNLSDSFIKESIIYGEMYGTSSSGGLKWSRANLRFIEELERFGLEESSGSCARIKIVEIDNTRVWEIEEEEGLEWIKYEDEELEEMTILTGIEVFETGTINHDTKEYTLNKNQVDESECITCNQAKGSQFAREMKIVQETHWDATGESYPHLERDVLNNLCPKHVYGHIY